MRMSHPSYVEHVPSTEPSSFHQPSNISSRLIIKEHLAICAYRGVLENFDGDLTDIPLASL